MMDYRSLTVRHATAEDVDYVVRRMRAQDRREVYGVRFSSDPDALIGEFVAGITNQSFAYFYAVASKHTHRAIALIAIVLATPRAAFASLIATDEWLKIVLDVTRFIRDVVIVDCIKSGLRRVELRALASWHANRRWLESMGAIFECECPCLSDEPYAQYAWTNVEA